MAGGVTPKQIYQALIAAGASTTQAIGIMANMIAESSLNPEALGDNGTSFGLVQQHGAQYASLRTGNPVADMNAQIKVIAANGGFAAANGANGATAAGNFSANYERCTTCQPGQASYNQRVANAATVAGWVSSGNWPTSAGSATAAAQGGGSDTSTDATCAWALGTINLHVTSVGGGCIIHKTTIRHIVGGLLLASGGGVLLVGAALLTAAGFQQTKAGRAVERAAEVLPGTGQAVRVGRAYAAARRPPAAKPAAAKPAAAKPAAAKPAAAKPAAAKRELSAEDRAAMRARADQISRRVEPA